MTHTLHASANSLIKSYITLAQDEALWQTNISEALSLVAQRSQTMINASRCSIWLFSNNKKELNCRVVWDETGYQHGPHTPVKSNDMPDYLTALEAEQAINASDVYTDSRTLCLIESYYKPNNIYSSLDATLRREGAACGVICFEQMHRPRKWSEEEISFPKSVADLLSQLLMFYSLRNS